MVNIKGLNILSAILSFMILSGCREKYVEEPEVIDFDNLSGKMAFSRSPGNQIIILDFENKKKTTVTLSNNEPIWDSYVSLSPDGSTLAFAWLDNTGYQIYKMPVTGGNAGLLTENNSGFADHNFYPAWTRDCSGLYYINGTSLVGGTVKRMASSGDNNVFLTDFAVFGRVSATDDEKIIVFSMSPWEFEYTKGIYSFNSDTEELTLIKQLDSTQNCFCPELSPDGTKIAFVLRHGINEYGEPPFYFKIVIMNIDGTDEYTVKTLPFNNYYSSAFVTWSPDGTRLAFNCNQTGEGAPINLYSIKTDGTDLIQITSASDYDGAPSWVE